MTPPLVTFSNLGRLGQFGNQLFQYAFMRLLADSMDGNYACPAWIGQELFGLVDPPIPSESPAERFEIAGWFQYHTAFYRPHRERIRQWFTFKEPPVEEPEGCDLIAIHLRRGDYATSTKGFAFVPPDEWYMRWLDSIWDSYTSPILYISTDDSAAAGPFQKYEPLIGLGFEADFYVMTQAKALAISNSTFSFAAAMLNTQAREFVRPVIDRYPMTGSLQRFDPWDSEPLLHRDRPEV